MSEKFLVGILVSNHFGVLNRVSGLFAKRCYNIDSLAVGETEDPNFSRITIASTGDEYVKEQVVKQLRKLHDVKEVTLIEKNDAVSVEHALVKLKSDGYGKAKINEIIDLYGGRIMDFSHDFVTAEITGDSEKIDRFLSETKSYGILEMCRSGLISLVHGTQNLMSVSNLSKSAGLPPL